MQNQKGFTLLELLSALAVAVILVTVAVPGMQAVTTSSRQASSVNELVSAFHVTRSTAVTQNTQATLCASDDGETCGADGWQDGYIVFRDIDSDQKVDADDSIISRSGPINGITVRPAGIGLAVTYRSNGRINLPGANGVIGALIVCDAHNSSHARGFAVDISGRPRVLPNENMPEC